MEWPKITYAPYLKNGPLVHHSWSLRAPSRWTRPKNSIKHVRTRWVSSFSYIFSCVPMIAIEVFSCVPMIIFVVCLSTRYAEPWRTDHPRSIFGPFHYASTPNTVQSLFAVRNSSVLCILIYSNFRLLNT